MNLLRIACVFAGLGLACTIPDLPIPNTITDPFRLQVQNATVARVHNKFTNLVASGGGDQHLFIDPVGTPTSNFTLSQGVIQWQNVRAVIGGEYSQIDSTTKMFMTGRGDPRAIFEPVYGCNPDTDEVQIELEFVTWQNHPAGGWICVRPSYDNGHEFRYYPPDNNKVDPNRTCYRVTLVVVPAGDGTVEGLP
ncbi:hypothetical protein B0I35DRAFT_513330 [Stachybotrys elegans]|uniref:DUF7909 domain-containing protein n=1 Tax=Stachybotrys elegans TaxID=80388 RepID=A0A8K0STJ4_9HYPO|nr:hypothetical protein B0I35DRAFT_513330 [Stachybotrys elegans]